MDRKVCLIALWIAISIFSLTQSVTARPCKSLLITSYSFSIKPHLNPNPNPNNPSFDEFLDFLAEFAAYQRQNEYGAPEIEFDHAIFPSHEERDELRSFSGPRHQFQESDEISSIGDRTKDILSVVVALLFGVGCGALTAAIMYMVWSIMCFVWSPFSNRYAEYDQHYGFDEESDESDDEIAATKKMGYVKAPDAEEPVKPFKEVSSV